MESNRLTADPYQSVALQLAAKGTDLWSAVEAAQYARLIDHEPPESSAEAEAMTAFVEIFLRYAESWDEVPSSGQVAALDRIGANLTLLRRHGLFVHSGTVERSLTSPGGAAVRLPVAVLKLGRSDVPTLAVMVPSELEVSGE